jgi:hypothetical protein
MPPYIHKRFRRLALYISYKSRVALPFRQLLDGGLWAFYSSYLKGPSFHHGICCINIYLTSLAAEDRLVQTEVRGFLDYYILFDFHEFAQLTTDQERQHYILSSIQPPLMQLAQQEGWDTARFEQAYQACLGRDFSASVSM